MKKVIYSVITGGYDVLMPAPKFPGWDVVMFTDEMPDNAKGWELRAIPPSDNPVLKSREVKILSHVFLPKYDLVCYMDANQKIILEPPSHPARFYHPRRQTIFQEARQIIINGRFMEDEINEQIGYYIDQGYEDQGLFLNGFSVRDNKDHKMNYLHDIWYEETTRFTPRDQLSLPYAIWKTGIQLSGLRERQCYSVVQKAHPQIYSK